MAETLLKGKGMASHVAQPWFLTFKAQLPENQECCGTFGNPTMFEVQSFLQCMFFEELSLFF